MTDLMDPLVVYFNARVHGMKSHLLSNAQLEELLAQEQVQRLVDALLESEYRTDMAEALSRYQGADAIEDALSRNLAATFNRMIKGSTGDFRELVRIFLTRWDLGAVKGLLRCQHLGLDAETTVNELYPGPNLPLPVLRELAGADSMERLVGALIAWNRSLCGGLRKALPAYEESRDLSVLEDVLDRAYFVDQTRALRASGHPDAEILAEYLGAEIDRINLRTIFMHFQVAGGTDNLRARLLPEGRISIARLEAMAATGDLGSALALLDGGDYAPLLSEYLEFVQSQRFGPIERYFERLLIKTLLKLSRRDVFGIGVMMNFVWLKYNEVINLRLIARGVAGSIPKGRVRDEIYLAN
jgi:V/A-type H+-transporting ATPase subunit C